MVKYTQTIQRLLSVFDHFVWVALKGLKKINFKPDRTFDRQAYFPKQNFKKWEDFQNAPEIKIRGTKTNGQNSHTRKQGNGKKESTY